MTDPTPAAPVRAVPTRRVTFDQFDQVPRYFAASDNLILCHLTACLSAMFPDGEDFFVRSVRHFRDRITDPALKRQVAGFMGQESIHGREHRTFNDRLAELGYPTKAVEWVAGVFLAAHERFGSAESNLALTAGLEHFTATLAELVLEHEESRAEFGDPHVTELFLWHALEESEHKAVAFDVYRAVGASERTRVRTMRTLRPGFMVWTGTAVALSLLGDPATYRPGNLRRSWRQFRRSPMAQRAVWDRLGDYMRADFHPDDHDSSELIAFWREELFGADGTLNSKLPASSAA